MLLLEFFSVGQKTELTFLIFTSLTPFYFFTIFSFSIFGHGREVQDNVRTDKGEFLTPLFCRTLVLSDTFRHQYYTFKYRAVVSHVTTQNFMSPTCRTRLLFYVVSQDFILRHDYLLSVVSQLFLSFLSPYRT